MRFIDRLKAIFIKSESDRLLDKQLEFLHNNYTLIMAGCYQHEDKIGYLQLMANKDFELVEDSVKFIEGDFNKDEFFLLDPIETTFQYKFKRCYYMYYSIVWLDHGIVWNFKELTLVVEKFNTPVHGFNK